MSTALQSWEVVAMVEAAGGVVEGHTVERALRPAKKVCNGPVKVVATRKVSMQVPAKKGGTKPKRFTVVVLEASMRGRNARGTAAVKRGWGGSQPKGAKRAKRQGAERMGRTPNVRTTAWPTTN